MPDFPFAADKAIIVRCKQCEGGSAQDAGLLDKLAPGRGQDILPRFDRATRDCNVTSRKSGSSKTGGKSFLVA